MDRLRHCFTNISVHVHVLFLGKLRHFSVLSTVAATSYAIMWLGTRGSNWPPFTIGSGGAAT